MDAFIKETKAIKGHRKSVCTCRKYPCKPCKKLNQKLCRGYHDKDNFSELLLRIQYEYVFDYITEEQMIIELKYFIPILGTRDPGHEKRMKRLFAGVRNRFKQNM
jgi:hypothetical protein